MRQPFSVSADHAHPPTGAANEAGPSRITTSAPATTSGTDANGVAYTPGTEMITVPPSTVANVYVGTSSCSNVH